ncbi:unnamed protein product [Caenorhabditis angaria]|uniref:Ig-like domain-containing protein n=1 Tax=Caenorhabditis angaria TaxID=860376 RepID=A0A9P1I5R5_9PELO|nr:unnamed protein product [Caenorhabditis angaria]
MMFFTFFFFEIAIFLADCSRAPPPTVLRTSMASATVLRGEDMVFTCIINHLGSHMVAFVKSDTPLRLISFDERVFRSRDKYEVRSRVGDSHNEWTLTIKNVDEADRGNYSCQVNTDPPQIVSGNLDVKVPPQIARKNPTDYIIQEGDNVTMLCRAEGNPKPTVTWRRADRQIIRYNGAQFLWMRLKSKLRNMLSGPQRKT